MKVTLNHVTPDAENAIVKIARVSSKRTDKVEKPEGLLNYLIKHKHWSPFEHGYMSVEIETSKAIGIQLIRHRSFTFQEFSQRYQDVNLIDGMFENVEIRKQAEDNRQSSTEVFNPDVYYDGYSTAASAQIGKHFRASQDLYKRLLDEGVAREVARMVLPLSTKTKIHMTGSIRSWIHFLDLRDDAHAQKEIQDVAKEIKKLFIQEFPVISKALNY